MTANDNSLPVRRSGSQKRQRNHKIGVACDAAEFVIIDDKARTAGMSLASFLRQCALGSPGPRARRAPPVNAEVLAHATAALNKAGSNLNQIARTLNAGGAKVMASEYVEALMEVRRCRRENSGDCGAQRTPMIAKGTTHNNRVKLARYMSTAKEGERVERLQLCGFADGDIREAFRSVHVMAEATRCEQPFFHVQVRNPDEEELTRDQWLRVANRIESKLGLTGQPRAIYLHIHEQTGHEHMHVAWSRIDGETLTAKHLPFFKERLKEVSRELEIKLDLTRVTNERDGTAKAPTQE